MPKVTLTYAAETDIPSELKAFKTAENRVEVWVNSSQEAVAAELNPALEKNRNDIRAEKEVVEAKYKALVSTTSSDDQATAKKIADLELKTKQPAISEADQKFLDAVKSTKGDITPEYVKEAVAKYSGVNEELTKIRTTNDNSKFFAATGFKSEKAFQKAISDKDANPKLLKHYTETKTENGKEVTVAYADVKKDDGTTEKVLFSDYVDKHADWDVYKPSLAAVAGSSQTFLPGSVNQPAQHFGSTSNAGFPSNNLLDAVQQGMNAANAAKTNAAKEAAKT